MEIMNTAAVPEKTKRKHKFKKPSVFEVVIWLLLAVISLSYLYMMFWTIITSLKDIDDFMHNRFGLPDVFAGDNLIYVINNFEVPVRDANGIAYMVGIPTMFWNTVVYVLGCGLMSTVVPFLTAYLVSKYRYKFSKILYLFVVIAMCIPVVGTQAASITLMQDLGLYDTQWGVPLMKGSIISMYFLIMVAAFDGVSDSMIEAAEVDGASQFRIMVQIVMPRAMNVFWTVFLINSISFWNEYTTAYMYQPNYPTLSVALYSLVNKSTQNISYPPYRMAACLALMVPVLILFLCFHNRMMNNLSMGGVKE